MSDRFTGLVRECTGAVWRLITRVTGDSEEARDLTQEVMIKVLPRTDRLRDPAKLKAYLFRTAYHTALNATRGRRRRERAYSSYADEIADLVGQAPDSQLEVGRTAEQMHAAVADLADRQRQVVTLRYYGGLTLAEVAAALKISEGTAKVHLARALNNLRTSLAPVAGEEI